MARSFHFTDLPASDAPPEWLQLLPGGIFSGQDGRGPFQAGPDIVAESQRAGPLIIDVNHSTDLAAPKGLPAPAVVRITALDWRGDAPDGGLWGQAEWSSEGQRLHQERAYFGISPVFDHSDVPKGRVSKVQRVLRASLTNVPNLTLRALNSQQETSMSLPAQLAAAFGLTGTVDDAALLAHAQTLVSAHAAQAALRSTLLTALALDPKTDDTQVVTALNAKIAGPQADPQAGDTVRSLQSQVADLTGKITRMQAEAATAAAVADVDAVIDGGYAAPAERPDLLSYHASVGGERFRKAMATRPKIIAGPAVDGQPPASDADPAALARRATALMAKAAEEGEPLTFAEAVNRAFSVKGA